jgi:hypothetical protein
MNRVFISCGQATDEERRIAQEICALVRRIGFDAYLAIEAQTLLDINSGIIGELKASDYYLLINFCRDPLLRGNRGSLFSNQELAIAYALGFKRLLILNQAGVADEGMLRYIGINTERFDGYGDCVDVVARAVQKAAWKPGYSRLLRARWPKSVERGHSLQGTYRRITFRTVSLHRYTQSPAGYSSA